MILDGVGVTIQRKVFHLIWFQAPLLFALHKCNTHRLEIKIDSSATAAALQRDIGFIQCWNSRTRMVPALLSLSMVPLNGHLWYRCPNCISIKSHVVEVPFTSSFRRLSFLYPDGGGKIPCIYIMVVGLGATDQLLWNSETISKLPQMVMDWRGRKELVAMARKIDVRNALFVVNGTVSSLHKCVKIVSFSVAVYVLIR